MAADAADVVSLTKTALDSHAHTQARKPEPVRRRLPMLRLRLPISLTVESRLVDGNLARCGTRDLIEGGAAAGATSSQST